MTPMKRKYYAYNHSTSSNFCADDCISTVAVAPSLVELETRIDTGRKKLTSINIDPVVVKMHNDKKWSNDTMKLINICLEKTPKILMMLQKYLFY